MQLLYVLIFDRGSVLIIKLTGHERTHIQTNTHTQTNIQAYTNTHTQTNIKAYTNTHTQTNIQAYTNTHSHTHGGVLIRVL